MPYNPWLSGAARSYKAVEFHAGFEDISCSWSRYPESLFVQDWVVLGWCCCPVYCKREETLGSGSEERSAKDLHMIQTLRRDSKVIWQDIHTKASIYVFIEEAVGTDKKVDV